MKSENLFLDKARRIIKNNNYMVLATYSRDSKPWATPVYYVYDKNFNFYIMTDVKFLHSRNMMANPQIGVAIFDSSQRLGSYEVVQIEATTAPVKGKELEKAIDLYCRRLFPDSDMPPTERYSPDEFGEKSSMKFFRITPVKAFVTGSENRVEVELG